MRVEKLWGWEDIICNDIYCMKMLHLNPGFQSSLHMHPIKDETFLVVDGCCDLEVDGAIRRMVPTSSHHLMPGVPHRFWAVNGPCTIVEASTPHSDDDVVRLEESKEIK